MKLVYGVYIFLILYLELIKEAARVIGKIDFDPLTNPYRYISRCYCQNGNPKLVSYIGRLNLWDNRLHISCHE
jgi:hypothetical protein